jgi:hypothetical protein
MASTLHAQTQYPINLTQDFLWDNTADPTTTEASYTVTGYNYDNGVMSNNTDYFTVTYDFASLDLDSVMMEVYFILDDGSYFSEDIVYGDAAAAGSGPASLSLALELPFRDFSMCPPIDYPGNAWVTATFYFSDGSQVADNRFVHVN